ncbi:mechanosensitive ion channel [Arsenicitalea aurantiaca]|uniref:Mechanosensitive ion channel n=1 Tax=Arsenicitalea aurantiaca TaxID=1783274 RepID=A0A433XAP2_9HYPH|nr:mechanosensitive ion channel domain-containing protein [Arsenicitalea aurantiaca]RUT31124.1 mechanosensitive ion channel [Arsenicitalea aurantiaca]
MRRLIPLLLLLLSLFPLQGALAQVPGLPGGSAPAAEAEAAAPAEAGIDELIRILENDAARAELLARLRASAGEVAAPPAEDETLPQFDLTLAGDLAEYTRSIAEGASSAAQSIVEAGGEIAQSLAGRTAADNAQIRQVALGVLMVGAALFASFFVLRLGSGAIQHAIARRAAGRSWVGRSVAVLMSTLVDLAAVLLAWGIGYLVALLLVGGTPGRMGINQTLLLNAFLIVETVKVGVRAVFQPRDGALRILPISDTSANYWVFWFGRIISLLGYAMMFVSPILAAYVSIGASQAVEVLAMVTAVIIAILIVLQNKLAVRGFLTRRAAAGKHDVLSQSAAIVGRYWHIIAIAYLIALLLVWLANPETALPFMLGATVQSLVAILVGSLVVSFISRFVSGGIRLPDDVRDRLPLLESRLHAFVPRVMQVVRTIVVVSVVIAIAQAWGLIDFIAWIGTEGGQRVAGSLVSAGLIILVGIAVYLAMSSWVEYKLNPNYGTVPTAREKTLLSLLRNAVTIALVVLVTMLALAQIGVNIAPLLAGAGVLGLAIGFGAQKFVQDIITGAFIQLENVMNEGDVVEAGGRSGVVEKLTIRSVSIRSLDGTLHLIPFSSVDLVSNMMKGFSFHVAEIRVAYREDIDEVKEAMFEAFELMKDTEHAPFILGDLEWHGVTAFGDSAVMVRARIKTLPGKHWGAGRTYNEFVKRVFDKRGIEIPFPHVTLYMGEGKSGEAPPLHLAGKPVIAPPEDGASGPDGTPAPEPARG